MCAAAALMTVSGDASRREADGTTSEGDEDATGFTGPAVNGDSCALLVVLPPPQHFAR